MRQLLIGALLGLTVPTTAVCADDLLRLETRIPLGNVAGRIDHMAVDLKRQRAFIAELGNNSLGVVDLNSQTVMKRISGLKEPQGVAYVAATDRLFVANAGDGVVRMFTGDDLAPAGEVALGEDADNIRVDAANRVFVGHGKGGIAILDGGSGRRIGDLPLAAHPEAFEIDPGGKRVFVNEPAANHIAVVDAVSGKELAKWAASGERGNFPMALDAASQRLFVVYRNGPGVSMFDTQSGKRLARAPTCGDADDVFFDARRRRLYVSCGDGNLAILDGNASLKELARLPTRSGARTMLFADALDRLLLPVRAQQGAAAELWLYRP